MKSEKATKAIADLRRSLNLSELNDLRLGANPGDKTRCDIVIEDVVQIVELAEQEAEERHATDIDHYRRELAESKGRWRYSGRPVEHIRAVIILHTRITTTSPATTDRTLSVTSADVTRLMHSFKN